MHSSHAASRGGFCKASLKSKAAENYEKFISLWKDCEPRFRPLVEDARKRLAALKSS